MPLLLRIDADVQAKTLALACRATQLRQQPHAALVAPQHLAASVRSPQVSVNLDNEGHCRQIRLAARWQDVYSIVGAEAALSPATTAFALHRLGCLFVYMSWQRRTGELIGHVILPALCRSLIASMRTPIVAGAGDEGWANLSLVTSMM